MEARGNSRANAARSISTKLHVLLLIAGVCCLAPGLLLAQQVESAVACDEGVISEPVAMTYGDHTENCQISPATDTDRFSFAGAAGDQVRFNVDGNTGHFDPAIEVRDPTGAIVGTNSCSSSSSITCSFSLDLTLAQSGNYFATISDVGTDQAGDYTLQLEKIFPAPVISRLDYDSSAVDTIAPTTDVDHYHFNGTAGTSIRFNVNSTTGHFDPAIEVRDPNGAVVIDGFADGAGCSSVSSVTCSFSVDLALVVSGTYSVVLYDIGNDQPGNYQISLWCLVGPCESVAGTPDPAAPVLSYDESTIDTITPTVDGDFFDFNGTAGTSVRFNVNGTTGHFDPAIEVRDPNGVVVIDGFCSSSSSITCSFSVDLVPAVSGTYSVVLYDIGTDQTGNYQISLWCLVGPCESVAGVPDPAAPVLSYVVSVLDIITPTVDGDFYDFNGTAGTSVRFNVNGTTGHFDPAIEVRDPNGTVVIDGFADGAGCSSVSSVTCSFSVDLAPTVSGTYSVVLYDIGTDQPGNYQISLWCLRGDCDSDSDGFPDGDRLILDYGDNVSDAISPAVDGDFFLLGGTSGDQIRLNVNGNTGHFDPTLECLDPSGVRVLNGAADGASCSSSSSITCSFSVDVLPATTGTYSCVLYDAGSDNPGNYEISLQCLFGTCADLTPPSVCGDNCSIEANANQRDTNGDGFGNLCDPDFNGNGIVDPADFSLLKSRFGRPGFPDQDLNGNGIVDPFDFSKLKSMFGLPPGPSCIAPNAP